jgi:hypothetical protein
VFWDDHCCLPTSLVVCAVLSNYVVSSSSVPKGPKKEVSEVSSRAEEEEKASAIAT